MCEALSHLSIWTSDLVSRLLPYLSVWQFNLSIPGSSAGRSVLCISLSFFALAILSLYPPAVYLCESACVGAYVGQTARPLNALGGLPCRLLLSVLYCVFAFCGG